MFTQKNKKKMYLLFVLPYVSNIFKNGSPA